MRSDCINLSTSFFLFLLWLPDEFVQLLDDMINTHNAENKTVCCINDQSLNGAGYATIEFIVSTLYEYIPRFLNPDDRTSVRLPIKHGSSVALGVCRGLREDQLSKGQMGVMMDPQN